MTKPTDEIILATVRRIEDHQASTDRDMAKDRQELQNLNIRLEAVESQIAQMRKAINTSAERTRDCVAEAVEPVINSTDKLTTQIEKKKMVVLGHKKRSLLDIILGKG